MLVLATDSGRLGPFRVAALPLPNQAGGNGTSEANATISQAMPQGDAV